MNWANDNTLLHPQKVPSVYNKCFHYRSSISLQFTDKQQLKFIMYGVSRYYADVKKTIIFSSNFLTFVISFLGTHSYFLLTISNIT